MGMRPGQAKGANVTSGSSGGGGVVIGDVFVRTIDFGGNLAGVGLNTPVPSAMGAGSVDLQTTGSGAYTATGDGSMVGGFQGNEVANQSAIAWGDSNRISDGTFGVAFGAGNRTFGTFPFASGNGNIIYGSGSSAFGFGNSIGTNNQADSGVFVAGDSNTLIGQYSLSFGVFNSTNSFNSMAIGNNNSVNGASCVGLGQNNVIGEWDGSTALTPGYNGSLAIGSNNTLGVTAISSIGLGNNISGDFSIGFGTENITRDENSAAVGRLNNINGKQNNILGYNNYLNGRYCSVLGSSNIIGQWSGSTPGEGQAFYTSILGYNNTINEDCNYGVFLGQNLTSDTLFTTLIGSFLESNSQQVALGIYNDITDSRHVFSSFVIANGTGSTARNNSLMVIDKTGATTKGIWADAFGTAASERPAVITTDGILKPGTSSPMLEGFATLDFMYGSESSSGASRELTTNIVLNTPTEEGRWTNDIMGWCVSDDINILFEQATIHEFITNSTSDTIEFGVAYLPADGTELSDFSVGDGIEISTFIINNFPNSLGSLRKYFQSGSSLATPIFVPGGSILFCYVKNRNGFQNIRGACVKLSYRPVT